MDRRSFLASASACAALTGCGRGGASHAGRVEAILNDAFEARLAAFPEFALSQGDLANRHKWDPLDRSVEDAQLSLEQSLARRMREQVDPSLLDKQSAISRDVFLYDVERASANAPYRDHLYLFSPMRGRHTELPTALINTLPARSRDDVDAYILRLEGLGAQLDGYRERAEEAAAYGVRPPAFLYDRVIASCRVVITGAPFDLGEADCPLFADLRQKLVRAGVEGEGAEAAMGAAAAALTERVKPAYERLIAFLERDKALAHTEPGVWRLPDGEAFYAERLRTHTTTDLTADEIHELGLSEVMRLRSEIKSVMRDVGFSGEVADFFRSMRENQRFYLPNNEEGRESYRRMAEDFINGITPAMKKQFFALPTIPLEVRQVEPFRRESAGKAFYSRGAADASRTAVFYVNTVEMADMPTYMIEGRAYHEGLPGHHMQIATAQQLWDLPAYRRARSYGAYSEGWGLYSERLAREMGFYKDPYSNFGRLAREIWRATRLVTDSGLHAKRWTRQEGVNYLLENTPHPEGACIAAIDRYSAMPGQATAYSIGMLKILELREKFQTLQGDSHDPRDFHDRVLSSGPLPLAVLEKLVSS